MYGPVPVEVALFADGGVAWDTANKPAVNASAKRWEDYSDQFFR
jgi:hypothetical protein